jgi:hypothetical protein
MIETLFIFILIVFIYIFIYFNRNEVTYVESLVSGKEYLVQNKKGKLKSADILAEVEKKLYRLKDYLVENKSKYDEYKVYIDLLEKNFTTERTHIYEGSDDAGYTSYSVNKGEEIVFCLKSKNTGHFHDINLIMYVALHELSHIACPEIGHTDLFKQIFKFITEQSIKIGIYEYHNYETEPVEYCGMMLSSSIT